MFIMMPVSTVAVPAMIVAMPTAVVIMISVSTVISMPTVISVSSVVTVSMTVVMVGLRCRLRQADHSQEQRGNKVQRRRVIEEVVVVDAVQPTRENGRCGAQDEPGG